MKKALFLFIVSAILLLCGCVNDTVAQGGVVLRAISPAQSPKVSIPADENIVYVAPSGAKYHTLECPLFDEAYLPVTLEQAIQEGKEPCSRCH